MKKGTIATIVLLIVIVGLTLYYFLVFNSQVKTVKTAEISNEDSTEKKVKERLTIEIKQQEADTDMYDLLLYRDSGDVDAFELVFSGDYVFKSFEVNETFDAQLLNNLSSDGNIRLSFGKLTTIDKEIELTNDGAVVIGTFTVDSAAKEGDIKLNTVDSLVIDEEETFYVENYSFSLL